MDAQKRRGLVWHTQEWKGAQLPYLLPIGERAEAIAEAFQMRQNTTQEALQELYKLAEECEKAKDRKGG